MTDTLFPYTTLFRSLLGRSACAPVAWLQSPSGEKRRESKSASKSCNQDGSCPPTYAAIFTPRRLVVTSTSYALTQCPSLHRMTGRSVLWNLKSPLLSFDR